MGLLKDKELENGVIVKYHRIVSINNIINNQSIIEVASYTSEEKREEEKLAIENGEDMNVYIDTNYYIKEYEEETSIKKMYDYLKTIEEFSDSIND